MELCLEHVHVFLHAPFRWMRSSHKLLQQICFMWIYSKCDFSLSFRSGLSSTLEWSCNVTQPSSLSVEKIQHLISGQGCRDEAELSLLFGTTLGDRICGLSIGLQTTLQFYIIAVPVVILHVQPATFCSELSLCSRVCFSWFDLSVKGRLLLVCALYVQAGVFCSPSFLTVDRREQAVVFYWFFPSGFGEFLPPG